MEAARQPLMPRASGASSRERERDRDRDSEPPSPAVTEVAPVAGAAEEEEDEEGVLQGALRKRRKLWPWLLFIVIVGGVLGVFFYDRSRRRSSPSSVGYLTPALEDTPFLQPNGSARWTYADIGRVAGWPTLPVNASAGGVLQVEASRAVPGAAYLRAAAKLLYVGPNNTVTDLTPQLTLAGIALTADTRIAASTAPGASLLVAGPNTYAMCGEAAAGCVACNASAVLWGVARVLVMRVNALGNAYVGTSAGLFAVTLQQSGSGGPSFAQVQFFGNASVTALAWDLNRGNIAASTLNATARTTGNSWTSWWNIGLIDAPPTDMAFDLRGNLWLANSACVNVLMLNLTFKRISFVEGLPVRNLTAVSMLPWSDSAAPVVWLGSLHGVARFSWGPFRFGDDTTWRYFNGPRWLPALPTDSAPLSAVRSLALLEPDPNSSYAEEALVATDVGVARISLLWWTLGDKADSLEQRIPLHTRLGLISELSLRSFGDLSTAFQVDSDNDGSHTGYYLAAQSFRYAATKDGVALQNAVAAFEALEVLVNVTGVAWLPARSVIRVGDPIYSGGTWHNSTTMPGLSWKGDTSSDEVVGHMYAYPIFHDLVAADADAQNPGQAYGARAANLVVGIARYILDNDLYLIDVTGQPTTWGFWNPERLNALEWFEEQGVNSAQIIAFLLSAYRFSGNATLLEAAQSLVHNAGYGTNVVNTLITEPSQMTYFDQTNTWPAYFTYLFSNQTLINRQMRLTWERTLDATRAQRNALFIIMYGAAGGAQFTTALLRDALWCLRSWPVSQITWPFNNLERRDYTLNRDFHDAPLDGADGPRQATTVFAYEETVPQRWEASPFALLGSDLNAGGQTELEGTPFLHAYWMARFYQFLLPESPSSRAERIAAPGRRPPHRRLGAASPSGAARVMS